jgi:prepilin-type N-terminal cleavage/methylation domain-containing protein
MLPAARNNRSRPRAFSLVELLVTITVIAILAGVAVVSVRGLSSNADTASCSHDRQALSHAEEVHRANTGVFVTEPAPVSAGLLRSQSSVYDVVLVGSSYRLDPTGSCPAVGTSGVVALTSTTSSSASTSVSTTVDPKSSTTVDPKETTTTVDPGNVSTPAAVGTSNTTILRVNGVQQDVKASSNTAC